MSALRDAAVALTAAVDSACSFENVYPLYQPHAGPGCAVIVPGSPGGEWGRFDDGAYCNPTVTFRIVMLMGATDILATLDWFEERLGELVAAFSADPTCGGVVDGVAVESWSEPEQVNRPGGADLIQVVVTLTPFSIDGLAA